MTNSKEAYDAMIRELVADGVTDFDSVEPALAEIISWAKFGIADNAGELLEAAEGWHWDAITAAWQHGMAEEVQRLVRDGMRVIMSSRYSSAQRRMIKGPVQMDIDAEIARTTA